MSTLRVSNIEAKADPSSPSVNEKVKITNSNGDVMLQLDGATTGITTVGINTTTAAFTVDGNQNINFVGVVTAASLSGNLTGNVTGQLSGIQTSITVQSTGSITVGDKFINSSGIGIGTTTAAPDSASVGTLIYNTTTNQIQAYGPEGWTNVKSLVQSGLSATGGIIGDYTDPGPGIVYRSHTFTTSGTFEVTELSTDFPNTVEYLVVAGGGSGGAPAAGGGGAGGFRTNVVGATQGGPSGTLDSEFPVDVQSYTVTIGGGGASARNPAPGLAGSPSSFASITSAGGGYGAAYVGANQAGGPGGSGGGGAHNVGPGGSGTANQGYPGGSGNTTGNSGKGGGGGGAGGAGGAGQPDGVGPAGQGGAGQSSSITGVTTYYAGGGGGGVDSASYSAGTGGIGGGGDGGSGPGSHGGHGTQNTGGGGGGCGGGDNQTGSGGSGVVIVRYQIGGGDTGTAKATGGTVSFYGGKTIHTFLTSGTFTTPASFNETVEYVVIGGGGAGGDYHWRGGGGGAGAYRTGTTPLSGPGTVAVQVGGGGAPVGAPAPSSNANGNPSYFGTPITSPGGGAGGSWPNNPGHPGGSGGGGGGGPNTPVAGGTGTGDPYPGTIGATPVNGWGHDGGATAVNTQQGAGGGGAGAAGVPNAPGSYPTTYGFGGAGVQMPATFRNPVGSSIGTPGPNPGGYYVAGGGNGGGYETNVNPLVNTTQPVGGGGLGGIDPSSASERGYPGVANTGSGGGGSGGLASTNGFRSSGGNGGSGIVVVAYPT